MKKMKLYMLLLLVPLILMGCIEKGKPASGISVGVDSLGGYTWEQLQSQIGVGMETASYSLDTNIKDLNTLYKDTSGNITTTDKADILALKNKLILIDDKIRNRSSTFNYPTSKSEISDLDTQLTSNLKILSFSELSLLKTELQALYLADTTDVFIKDLNEAIKSTYNSIDIAKGKNTLYTLTSRLYFFYSTWLTVSNQATLKTSYNLDVKAVNQKASVTEALKNIDIEIAYLNDIVVNNRPIDFQYPSQLLSTLKSLRNTYSAYLSTNNSATFVNVSDKRFDLKSFEDAYFGPAQDLSVLENAVTDIETKLTNYSAGSMWEWKKNEILTYISSYKTNLAIYAVDNKSYEKVHSRIINLIKVIEYLRDQDIYINVTWNLNPLY